MLNNGLEVFEDYYDRDSGDYFGTFQNSGIAEITLPRALMQTGRATFSGCNNLGTVYVKSGYYMSLSELKMPGPLKVFWL